MSSLLKKFLKTIKFLKTAIKICLLQDYAVQHPIRPFSCQYNLQSALPITGLFMLMTSRIGVRNLLITQHKKRRRCILDILEYNLGDFKHVVSTLARWEPLKPRSQDSYPLCPSNKAALCTSKNNLLVLMLSIFTYIHILKEFWSVTWIRSSHTLYVVIMYVRVVTASTARPDVCTGDTSPVFPLR
jgi:hypothetical protein